MTSGNEYRRALVAKQFHRARRQAALESLVSRLSGQTADLLSFDEVVGKLGLSGQSSLGIRQIPIDAIVGSVGRYQDFSRTFLPRRESDEDRWVNVGAAAASVADLPPIDVYKIGDSYFVLDGNHRVSLARRQNIGYIDAAIIEVRTRAPLPPGARPDDLIIAAEHAAFLVLTQLDLLRPDSDLRVSVPGQYGHLESHVEAYRYTVETREGRDLSNDEAVGRWYDEVYLPLVQAIREQGILRYFPGRTETDFFIWLARHRAELQNELGLTISPAVTVSRLLSKVSETEQASRPPLGGRLRRLTRLMLPETSGPPPRTWAEERTLDRYSDHLFAHILYPIVINGAGGAPGTERAGLERALALARKEEAHLYALCVLTRPESPQAWATVETLRRLIADTAADDPVPCELVVERGHDPAQWALEVAFLNDLIILDRAFGAEASGGPGPKAAVRAIIEAAARPVLVAGQSPGAVGGRVLLVHDTRREFEEALFIAAYLAEMWRAELTVLPLSNGRNTEDVVARVGDYLALHEVNASFLAPVRPTDTMADAILDTALSDGCDLIVLSGAGRGRPNTGRRNTRPDRATDTIWAILQRWHGSVLIAT